MRDRLKVWLIRTEQALWLRGVRTDTELFDIIFKILPEDAQTYISSLGVNSLSLNPYDNLKCTLFAYYGDYQWNCPAGLCYVKEACLCWFAFDDQELQEMNYTLDHEKVGSYKNFCKPYYDVE